MFRQPTLFGGAEPAAPAGFCGVRRNHLDESTWIDHVQSWVSGPDTLFELLVATLPLHQKQVTMWGRLVDEPRLSHWWRPGGPPIPHPVLAEVGQLLGRRYGVEFDSIGFNLYRHGDDSVAWHADTKGPPVRDPIIAIVSVGARRALRLRPRGGGEGQTFFLGEGDLFVMGGSCQHDWEHCIPKSKHVDGPRLSITYRHSGVH